MTTPRTLEVEVQEWPLIKPFVISRSVDLSARVVVVRLTGGEAVGWGEATPYARYDETCDSVVAAIEAHREALESREGVTAAGLGLKGAAANAVDCALVDFACKKSHTRVWDLLGEAVPRPVTCTNTVSLDTPEAMAEDALKCEGTNLIKVKLGKPDGDVERIEAIRKVRPDARLICDANEGWNVAQLKDYAPALAKLGVEMIEQPVPAGEDETLRGVRIPVLLCADESCHTAADVPDLKGKYDLVNIKLDKAGGITGGMELVQAAKEQDMGIMVGCMLGTSLAMAPGILVAQHAKYVDLDAPLALSKDRDPAMTYRNGEICPAPAALWG